MPKRLKLFTVKDSSPALRAVIFDFDGTLLDTFPAIAVGFNAALSPIFGRTYTDAEVVSHFGPPDEGMIANMLVNHGRDEYDAAIARYFAAFEIADQPIQPFDGIVALLDELSARDIPLGIMTGKGRRAAEITIKRLGWHARFGTIITGDDAAHKPAPDGPLLAARELGIEPQFCAYVGDSPADVGAATAAGMKSVVAGWHGFFHEKLKPMNYDFWANSPAELATWLRAQGA